MALDTAAKRYSATNLTSPWRGVGITPSGTIGAGPRLALAFLYSGLGASTEYIILGTARSLVARVRALNFSGKPTAREVKP